MTTRQVRVVGPAGAVALLTVGDGAGCNLDERTLAKYVAAGDYTLVDVEADIATTENEPAVDDDGFAVTTLGEPDVTLPLAQQLSGPLAEPTPPKRKPGRPRKNPPPTTGE
jgi:hypothetical protein